MPKYASGVTGMKTLSGSLSMLRAGPSGQNLRPFEQY